MGPEATPGAPREEKRERPQDVSAWKKDDYYDAKKENDPRLAEAVAYLGEKFAGKPSAARLLTNLLKAEEPKEEPAEASPPGRRHGGMPGYEGMMGPGRGRGGPVRLSTQVIEAIVVALGVNGADVARQTLADLVGGKLKTDEDRTATKIALEVLADDPSPEEEAILFTALTTPEKLRPASKKAETSHRGGMPPGMHGGRSGPTMSAEELGRETLQLIEPIASEEFRVKLAQFLLNPKTPAAKVSLLRKMIETPLPENVGAQLLLYASREPDARTKETLEGYFTDYSSQALGYLLGILEKPVEEEKKTSRWGGAAAGSNRRMPGEYEMEGGYPGPRRNSRAGMSRTGQPSGPMSPKLAYQVAKRMWTPLFTQGTQTRLSKLDSLGESAKIVMLAGTIPLDATRAQIHQVLQSHWQEGPKDLESAGLLGEVLWDPGLLLLVKTLPRKEPEKKQGFDRGRGRGPRGPGRPPGGRIGEMGGGANDPNAAGRQWMQTSEDMLRLLCERFQAAARNAESPADASPESFPVKLHDGATITARFDLVWPDQAPKELADVALGPIEIHYVRIEEATRWSKMRGFYRRQIKSPKERTLNDGMWLDSFSAAEKPDRKQSVDILITRLDNKPDRSANEEEPLTVDILSIEMKVPKGQ